MADNVKINSIFVSGRKDKTLTYAQYVKDEKSGKGLDEVLSGVRHESTPISTKDLSNEAVTISKIAQEVWDKLKDEYLRLDGKNAMNGSLDMNQKSIMGIKQIYTEVLGPEMWFNKDGYPFEFGKQDTDGSEDPTFMPMFTIEDQLVKAFGNVEAKGYQTTDQSSFGLLGNEGSVVLAMSDTDVDGVLHEVFNDN